jgi:hypothetical protein
MKLELRREGRSRAAGAPRTLTGAEGNYSVSLEGAYQ